MKLLPHQQKLFEELKDRTNVGLFLDMGLGKSFLGAELANNYKLDIVIVCQKSLISMWLNHFKTYYQHYSVYNLCDKKSLNEFFEVTTLKVGVLNYDILFRDKMKPLFNLSNFTLLLDESSLIQNSKNKRGKATLKLTPTHTLLLTGSLMNGKYERLWSQCHLLGWDISEKTFLNHYCEFGDVTNKYGKAVKDKRGFSIKRVVGYKNIDRLKQKLRDYGGSFLKTEEVLDLPEQTFIRINVDISPEYKKFQKTKIVTIGDTTLVGDTTLTKLLYSRMLCGAYSSEKLQAFKDLVDSTTDRLIVFYNFTAELDQLLQLCDDKPVAVVNGKSKDLTNYENYDNSITFIQYQAGSFGLNLQKANKIVYFTPPLSSEHYEQSIKRTHRIGQKNNCFYYNLICSDSVEENIYATLKLRKDYTDELFKNYLENL